VRGAWSIVLSGLLAGAAAAGEKALLVRDPHCGCCLGYAEYLRAEGFAVTVKDVADPAAVKLLAGIPAHLEGCHTTEIAGYVVEGHVPVAAIRKLLAEKPAILGISLPGMPQGSPGMSGRKEAPFVTYVVGEGRPQVYAVE